MIMMLVLLNTVILLKDVNMKVLFVMIMMLVQMIIVVNGCYTESVDCNDNDYCTHDRCSCTEGCYYPWIVMLVILVLRILAIPNLDVNINL